MKHSLRLDASGDVWLDTEEADGLCGTQCLGNVDELMWEVPEELEVEFEGLLREYGERVRAGKDYIDEADYHWRRR